MRFEQKYLNLFKSKEMHAFYTVSCKDDYRTHEEKAYFSNYDLAYNNAISLMKIYSTNSFTIEKNYIDNATPLSGCIKCIYNKDAEIIFIDLGGETYLDSLKPVSRPDFGDFPVNIPTPFKTGDIVCDFYNKAPYVLDESRSYDKLDTKANKIFFHDLYQQNVPSCKMTSSGYTFDAATCSLQFHNKCLFSLNMEYYKNDLTGGKRLLSIMGLAKQGAISTETFSKLQQAVLFEELSKKSYQGISSNIEPGILMEINMSTP